MPRKGSIKKSSVKVGRSMRKGSSGKFRAPNNVSLKTENNNRAAVANNAGVNTKIGLTDDILRPLSKFAADLQKQINDKKVTDVPNGLEKKFLEICSGGHAVCFDSANLNDFPGLNKSGKSVNDGTHPDDQVRMCKYLKKVAKQVYSGKKFMDTRVRIMLNTMEKFFKAQEKPTRATTRSAKRLNSARVRSISSARSSTRRSARSSTRRSARSNSSGPPSNLPPPIPSLSTSSHPSQGINFNNAASNTDFLNLQGNCKVDEKVEELKVALNECSVANRAEVLKKLTSKRGMDLPFPN